MKRNAYIFYGQLIFTVLVCAFLVVPVIQSILAGITVNFFQGLKSGVTFRWFIEVWDLYRDTIFRSLLIAVACLGLDLVIGVPAAYAMMKSQSRIVRLLEEFLVIPLAVPGLAIALAMLISYGQFTAFRQSWLIILAGHVIFTLPFMIRAVIAVLASIPLIDYEEGAASLGAGFAKRFFTVVIPNSVGGILAGSLMVFTLSVGEFNLTWMLHTPLSKTLPVGLADSYASMRLEIGSAYTILFFFMIIPLLVAMQYVAKWQSGDVKSRRSKKMIQSKSDDLRKPPDQDRVLPGSTATLAGDQGTSVRLLSCSKTFPDGTRALEPVDLDISAGETVVILGPSGCGKTTTLRLIAGLESPDSGGRVFFGNDDVTDISIEKRNVGMVFQSYALFPNMNVEQNIVYGLKVRGLDQKSRQRRLEEMLEMMKIEELRHRHIDQLSGGQKQRVALARAIAVRPRILLLDEPLTALDAKLRDNLRAEIDMLLKSVGITAIYVTHDQSEAMALGNRIVVMDKGKIAQIGPPRDIYFRPINRFVAEFIGTVNRLKCRLEDNQLTFAGGSIPVPGNVNGRQAGESFDLYFRPEVAQVVDSGKGNLSGVVVSAFFLGDRTRLLVNGSMEEPIRVESPGNRQYQPGQNIDILLDHDAVFTLSE
jgi:putative spermidine/putrescine transport system ATP-binding protein